MFISKMRTISAKLGNMRKPQEFVVYPAQPGVPFIQVQSDKSIGHFDPATGRGMLNTKGCYFLHLSPRAGAVPYQFPMEFVEACKAAQAPVGETIVIG